MVPFILRKSPYSQRFRPQIEMLENRSLPASAGSVLDVSQEAITQPIDVNYVNSRGQTFTTRVDGILDSVDVSLAKIGPSPNPVYFTLYRAAGGLHTGNPLALLPVTGASSSLGFVTVDLTSYSIPVHMGDTFAFTLTNADFGSFINYYQTGASNQNPYDGGTILFFNNLIGAFQPNFSWDLSFRTHIVSSSDIAVHAAELVSGNTVQVSYSTTANPGPFTLALYRSFDRVFVAGDDPLVVSREITPNPTNPQLSVFLSTDPALFADIHPELPYVLAVADPLGSIAEANETNNVVGFLFPTDLEPISLVWNHTVGGVDFAYRISGSPALRETSAMLSWVNNSGARSPAVTNPISIPAGLATTDSIHVNAANLLTPPDGAFQLLLELDPPDGSNLHGLIEEYQEGNNLVSLAFNPTIQITAKYDGNPLPEVIGRFFPIPNAITDESLVIQLSEDLAALRPSLVTRLGNAELPTAPSLTSAGNWDGRTFETTSFDPGLYFSDLPIEVRATENGAIIRSAFATLDVERIPEWIKALVDQTRGFQIDSTGRDGSYVFEGLLANGMYVSHTIPNNVAFVGNRVTEFGADLGVTVRAPLNALLRPETDGFGLIRLKVLGLSVINQRFASGGSTGDGINISLTSGFLDGQTLNVSDGTAITVVFRTTVLKKSIEVGPGYYTFVPVGPVPVLVGVQPILDFDMTLVASVAVAFRSQDMLLIPGDGNRVEADIKGTPRVNATAGFFLPNPPRLRGLLRLIGLDDNGLFTLGVVGDLAGSLSFRGVAYYRGAVGLLERFAGQIDVKVDLYGELQLVLDLAGQRIWSSNKRKFHFPGLPKTWRVIL